MVQPGLHEAGRKKIVEMVTGCADGLTGKRLADEVVQLISQVNG